MSKAGDELNLETTYVQLFDGGAARLLPVDEKFWPDLMGGKRPDVEPGRMISMYHFAENWRSWERHPAGDELVILVSGEVEMLLEQPDGVVRKQLNQPGQYVLIPPNTWHTAHTKGCAMLFVTPGAGTEHKRA